MLYKFKPNILFYIHIIVPPELQKLSHKTG